MNSTTQQESTTNRTQLDRRRPTADSRPTSQRGVLDTVQATYDAILWRLRARHTDEQAMAVGLIGSDSQAGTTTIATKLAVRAVAQRIGRVLLVDAHWDSPALPATLGVRPGPGLFDILAGDLSPREWEPIAAAANLDLLPCGEDEVNYAKPVRPQMVEAMLTELRSQYSLMIVDLPPVEGLNNSLALARQLDGSLLIARCDALKQQRARRLSSQLQQDGVTLWGAVMNRHRDYVPSWIRRWW